MGATARVLTSISKSSSLSIEHNINFMLDTDVKKFFTGSAIVLLVLDKLHIVMFMIYFIQITCILLKKVAKTGLVRFGLFMYALSLCLCMHYLSIQHNSS
uniref:Uncharacterized protein n=1 Tax=Micrurus spixii TaxID=129469 RepID=A0A2D4LDX2_9SAUR